MCMVFDGVTGTCDCFKFFDAGDFNEDVVGERAGESGRSELNLLTASGLADGRGGGQGEMEAAVTEAECA